MPRYYTNSSLEDDGYYDTNQLRHARHGLHLGNSPPKPKSFDLAADQKTKTTGYDYEVSRPSPTSPAAEESDGQAAPSPPASAEGPALEAHKKGLTFLFRKQCDGCKDESPRHLMHYEHGPPDSTAIYHTVGGRRRRGFVTSWQTSTAPMR